MNLANLNVDEMDKAIRANMLSVRLSVLKMTHVKMHELIKSTQTIFDQLGIIRLGQQAHVETSPKLIKEVASNNSTIELIIGKEKLSLPYSFDDELGYWLMMNSHHLPAYNAFKAIIMTQVLSGILEFEVNRMSFNIVKTILELREP